MTKQYEKLSALLKELFQTNQADLDFGIYRVINQRRDEINKFLDDELLSQVNSAFKQYEALDTSVLNRDLKTAVKQAEELGINPEEAPRVKQIREQVTSYGVNIADLENQVYSALYNFFSRYYDEGDFISQRRYKEGVYAIPYEGEEVKLHWANHDQFYIKTNEYFRDYAFKLPSGKLAHFKLSEAEVEKDNRKEIDDKKRRFVLAKDPFSWAKGEPVFYFYFQADDQARTQAKCNEETLKTIYKLREKEKDKAKKEVLLELVTLAPTEKNKNRTLLEKHLEDYTRRNTQDYFIHKDLGKFLRRELDFYIKNEIMQLDNIESEAAPRVEQYLNKVRVIRSIAHRIIDFLAQIENFQKKLWLKKKFVVETNYCITLDRIPEEFYQEIATNETQREEWVRIFSIDEIKRGDMFKVAYKKPLTIDFLKANEYLVVDTKFFTEDFKLRLLSKLDDLTSKIDGLLINSENYQAVRLIETTFGENINSIYLDPPYNTDASPILYKNNYKHSSFVALMNDRLHESHRLLAREGIICVAIDDEEVLPLRFVLSNLFTKQVGIVCVRSNPAGRKTKGKLAPAHEYALFYAKHEDTLPGSLEKSEKSLSRYPKVDEKGRFAWANFIRSGNNDKREDRPKLYYPIFVSDAIRIPNMIWDDDTGEYALLEKPTKKETIVYPIVYDNGEKIEKNWQRGNERVKTELEEFRIRRNSEGEISIDFKTRMDEEALPVTWWDDSRYASANYGAAELKDLFGRKVFDFAKATRLVEDCIRTTNLVDSGWLLDFFAGSGTSGHAIINLNRTDNQKRKYILVEMGEYFNDVLKPRIEKAVYSADWSEGKPVSRKGLSHAFKYMRLESYEDTLNNLELSRKNEQQLALEENREFKSDYLLRYMLDVESKGSLLNIERFNTPFDYQLMIADVTVGEAAPKKVDLVETFNYMLGLHVKSIRQIDGTVIVQGQSRDSRNIMIIWRNVPDMNNAALDKFFKKHVSPQLDGVTDIYVNGDNNLANLRSKGNAWNVHLIEETFQRLMFEDSGG